MNEQRVAEVERKSPASEEDNLIIETVNKFLERDVKPFVKEFESEDKYPQLIADKMAETKKPLYKAIIIFSLEPNLTK